MIICLAQGHNAVTPLRLGTTAPRSRVKHSTTELLHCSPEHTKPLKHDCLTEPHVAFAFMHKSFAIMPRFYAQGILTGASSFTRVNEQQRFLFCNKRLRKWPTV